MLNVLKQYSRITLIGISLFIVLYRMSHVSEKEISWDVLGYYLYLPATFIYHQPMLNDTGWLKKINDEKDLTGTLYMVSSNDEGQPMYFFLMGMALFYLPFFLLAHFLSFLFGFPMDGFSPPYQYTLVFGGIIYTIIGLIYLRKILRKYFSEIVSSFILLIVVFGTNYIHHLTLKNLETVNVLFMLVCIILWNTIRWHEEYKFRNMLTIGIGITLMGLVKPSEILIVILPLLWNVTSRLEFKSKLRQLLTYRKQVLITLGICVLIAIPQMAYWYIKTGRIIYDTYKNPGVGLDLFSPHILNTLFSYRKGWLVYTPVMIFFLIGFIFLYRQNRRIFAAITVYFLVSFYIIASWTEWWYGAGFSIRPLITTYPVLAICLGYFLLFAWKLNRYLKVALGLIFALLVAFNQFQWWQFKHYIIDPYRTTKAYYWASFLKTSVSDKDKELLLVERSFTGENKFNDEADYKSHLFLNDSFDNSAISSVMTDSAGNSFYRANQDQEYVLTRQFRYKDLTKKDHLWIKASADIRLPEGYNGKLPCFVLTMEHWFGSYGYFAPEISADSAGYWKHISFEYLTPEIRSTRDKFKCYFWNRGRSNFDIDNYRVEVFERK
jgi:hypothetical protein